MSSDATRSSLVPWAKTLPSGWITCRIDAVADVLFSNVDKHTLDDEIRVRLCNYIDVYNNEKITADIDFMVASADAREITKFQIHPGDVLATKDSETPEDIAIPALVTEELPGVLCGYHLAMIRPRSNRVTGPYISWLHNSKQFRAQYEANAVGVTRFGLAQSAFKSALIPLPSNKERDLIVAYLDASCAAVSVAVAAKRRQLEILDNMRDAALHSAFAHLTQEPLERIKDVAEKIGSGVTPEGGAAGYLDSGIPLLRSQNVHFDGLRLQDVAFISAQTHAEMSSSQIQPGDVLLNITGASIGRCTFVPVGFGEGNVNQHVCIIRPGPKIDHRFLTSFLASPIGQDQILSTFTGASRQGLSHKELGLIRVPLPRLQKQSETVELINHEDIKNRQLRYVIQRQIDTLIDYRNSLIHECVTGQRRITELDLSRVVNSKEG